MRKNNGENKAYDPTDDVDEDAPMTAQNPNDLNPDTGISTLETVQENARMAAGTEIPGDATFEEPKSRKRNRKSGDK